VKTEITKIKIKAYLFKTIFFTTVTLDEYFLKSMGLGFDAPYNLYYGIQQLFIENIVIICL